MIAHFETAFAGDVRTVAEARRWTRQALTECGLSDDTVCDALTCVSELAANATRHTASGKPGGTYQVVVEVDGTRAHVEVVDQGADGAPDVHLGGGESGRGLWICAQLGELRYAHAPSGGRRVWVDLPRPAAMAPLAVHPADGMAP